MDQVKRTLYFNKKNYSILKKQSKLEGKYIFHFLNDAIEFYLDHKNILKKTKKKK